MTTDSFSSFEIAPLTRVGVRKATRFNEEQILDTSKQWWEKRSLEDEDEYDMGLALLTLYGHN